MNMDMKKKIFWSVIISISVIIVLLLVAIIILNSKKETRPYNGTVTNKNNTTNTTEEPDNEVDNSTENTITDDRKDIEGEITYETTSDGGTIPIPPTFKYVEGDSQTGAVIEDEDGNQFVWVPVSDYNSYHRQYFLNNGEEEKNKNDSETTLEDENIYDINAYNDEFDDSIRNYKGFYIARYEAGKERSNGKSILVSKPNVLPWTQIVWEEARKQSLKMYKENDLFQTDLVNSYAWDTICNWIRNCGYNIDNSTEYGNYQNSANGTKKVMETASNDRWKTNNIYDMAGNAWEYTTEECGEHDKKHIGRGGDYLNDGDKYPISTRATSSDESNLDVGFRVVLYLK